MGLSENMHITEAAAKQFLAGSDQDPTSSFPPRAIARCSQETT